MAFASLLSKYKAAPKRPPGEDSRDSASILSTAKRQRLEAKSSVFCQAVNAGISLHQEHLLRRAAISISDVSDLVLAAVLNNGKQVDWIDNIPCVQQVVLVVASGFDPQALACQHYGLTLTERSESQSCAAHEGSEFAFMCSASSVKTLIEAPQETKSRLCDAAELLLAPARPVFHGVDKKNASMATAACACPFIAVKNCCHVNPSYILENDPLQACDMLFDASHPRWQDALLLCIDMCDGDASALDQKCGEKSLAACTGMFPLGGSCVRTSGIRGHWNVVTACQRAAALSAARSRKMSTARLEVEEGDEEEEGEIEEEEEEGEIEERAEECLTSKTTDKKGLHVTTGDDKRPHKLYLELDWGGRFAKEVLVSTDGGYYFEAESIGGHFSLRFRSAFRPRSGSFICGKEKPQSHDRSGASASACGDHAACTKSQLTIPLLSATQTAKGAQSLIVSRDELIQNQFPAFTVRGEALPEGFVKSELRADDSAQREEARKVLGLDCEMCETASGSIVARVTVVDATLHTIYDSLVQPSEPITDYVTQFSGITAEMMAGATKSLHLVQTELLNMIDAAVVLVGHSLDNDLRALHLEHHAVIDTALLFPDARGRPYRRSLRNLVSELFGEQIQQGQHDSAIDAICALRLAQLKIKMGPLFGIPPSLRVPFSHSIFAQTVEAGHTCASIGLSKAWLCRNGHVAHLSSHTEPKLWPQHIMCDTHESRRPVLEQSVNWGVETMVRQQGTNDELCRLICVVADDQCQAAGTGDDLGVLDTQLSRLFASMVEGSLLVCVVEGNFNAARALDEQYVRSQFRNASHTWDEFDDDKLDDALRHARSGLTFLRVKNGSTS